MQMPSAAGDQGEDLLDPAVLNNLSVPKTLHLQLRRVGYHLLGDENRT